METLKKQKAAPSSHGDKFKSFKKKFFLLVFGIFFYFLFISILIKKTNSAIPWQSFSLENSSSTKIHIPDFFSQNSQRRTSCGVWFFFVGKIKLKIKIKFGKKIEEDEQNNLIFQVLKIKIWDFPDFFF